MSIELYFDCRLAGYVYEYLVHNGATKTAESFKGEMLCVSSFDHCRALLRENSRPNSSEYVDLKSVQSDYHVHE